MLFSEAAASSLKAILLPISLSGCSGAVSFYYRSIHWQKIWDYIAKQWLAIKPSWMEGRLAAANLQRAGIHLQIKLGVRERERANPPRVAVEASVLQPFGGYCVVLLLEVFIPKVAEKEEEDEMRKRRERESMNKMSLRGIIHRAEYIHMLA